MRVARAAGCSIDGAYELKQASGQAEFAAAGLSIGEVARKAGLRASAIRYYEKCGLLPAPPRVSGRRRYDATMLDRLAMVRFAQYVGLGIAEIKFLLDGVVDRPPPERWRKLAHEKVIEVEALIAQAKAIRKKLRETLDHTCPRLVEQGRVVPPRRLKDEGRRHRQ
jgi:MerR family redox-sensitive transcriptional activator SoxR